MFGLNKINNTELLKLIDSSIDNKLSDIHNSIKLQVVSSDFENNIDLGMC